MANEIGIEGEAEIDVFQSNVCTCGDVDDVSSFVEWETRTTLALHGLLVRHLQLQKDRSRVGMRRWARQRHLFIWSVSREENAGCYKVAMATARAAVENWWGITPVAPLANRTWAQSGSGGGVIPPTLWWNHIGWLIAVMTGIAWRARRVRRWEFHVFAARWVSSQEQEGVRGRERTSKMALLIQRSTWPIRRSDWSRDNKATLQTYSTCVRRCRVRCSHNGESLLSLFFGETIRVLDIL